MAESGDEWRAPAPPPLRDAPVSGSVLCFSPHPDDEVIGPGGALCLHRRQGDPVRVVVVSDGTAGDPDGRFAGRDYSALRRDESRRGLAELGVDDLEFWGAPDACDLSASDIERGVRQARAEIEAFSPQVVYAPWEGDGNSDHRALYWIVTEALRRIAFAGRAFGYEVWDAMVPDFLLDVTPVAEAKRRALRCYESQLAYVDYEHVIFGLNAYRSLVHRRGEGFCEGYRDLVRGSAP